MNASGRVIPRLLYLLLGSEHRYRRTPMVGRMEPLNLRCLGTRRPEAKPLILCQELGN